MEAEVARDVDLYGGLVVVEALAREFGLWEKVRAIESLDLRKRKTHGYSPELIIAQRVLNKLLGVARGADASTLGEWLRGQSEAGIQAVQGLIREFAAWVMSRVNPETVRRDGKVEVFF
jgi:hypothetical protein